MAKPVNKRESRRKQAREVRLPLGKQNFLIMGVGLLVIIVGYLTMLSGTVEGFLPLVVSPILLLVGYCVLIPIGILYRPGAKGTVSGEPSSKEIAR